MIVRTPDELRAVCNEARTRGRVAFVPTMGALHEGHLALVRRAREAADFVVVSIFVNPTQFGPNEDFARYPRDLAGDTEKLAPLGVSAVFAPEPSAMYAPGEETRVHVGALAAPLCGGFRPGHFEGVATVVAKLFAIVGPCDAVFGRKDYQQLAILRRVVTDLFFPVNVIGHPIVREVDGLAMSSRNAYLSAAERARALGLSRGLRAASDAFARGERDAAVIGRLARAEVDGSAAGGTSRAPKVDGSAAGGTSRAPKVDGSAAGGTSRAPKVDGSAADSIDYVSVVDADSLAALTTIAGRALVAVACRIGKTRLIDNFVLGEDDPASLTVAPRGAA